MRKYEDRFGMLDVRSARTSAEALEWFEEMLNLHDLRWKAAGEESGFTERARDFHRKVIDEILSDDRDDRKDQLHVDLAKVTAGTETIGILYHLIFRGHVHFYQSGLQYHDDPHLKPGLVSHAVSIEESLRRGDVRYDFLGGEAEPVRYKRSLSTDLESVYWARLPNDTVRERILSTARRLQRLASDALRR